MQVKSRFYCIMQAIHMYLSILLLQEVKQQVWLRTLMLGNGITNDNCLQCTKAAQSLRTYKRII
jgi:hypothetical protein